MGLRERKKTETRQAVHEAALRLTVEHGFDAVTVEAIADAANISRRTFSNYFTGKEDALLYGDEQRIRALVARIRARPAREAAWPALREAVIELYRERTEPDREWALRTRLARRHPTLLARQLASQAELERDLAVAIAERDGGDPAGVRARVMAATYLTTLRVGSHLWVEEKEARPLDEVIADALDQLPWPG